jgi:hypothetical protein
MMARGVDVGDRERAATAAHAVGSGGALACVVHPSVRRPRVGAALMRLMSLGARVEVPGQHINWEGIYNGPLCSNHDNRL